MLIRYVSLGDLNRPNAMPLTALIWRRRFGVHRIQWEASIAGNVEARNGQRIHFLHSLRFIRAFL